MNGFFILLQVEDENDSRNVVWKGSTCVSGEYAFPDGGTRLQGE
jgi:hypothetical protein